MTRDDARVNWQQIAARRFTPELLEWLAQIAPLVLDADRLKDANKRRLGIVEAVGLAGRAGTMATAAVRAMNEVDATTLGDSRRQQRETKEMLLKMALGVPLGTKGIDRDNVRDRVRRRLKK